MLSPRTHADPAELFLAELAAHMIASLILFNAGLAIGAFFGIGQNPIRSFRLTHTFLQPVSKLSACARVVRFFAAFEAERAQAGAAHSGDARADRHLVAPRCGAIFHRSTGFDKVSGEVHVVFVENAFIDQQRPGY